MSSWRSHELSGRRRISGRGGILPTTLRYFASLQYDSLIFILRGPDTSGWAIPVKMGIQVGWIYWPPACVGATKYKYPLFV